MDAETVGKIVLGVGAAVPVCWAGWQLFHSFFGKFAKREMVDSMKTDVDTIRASMVTRDDFTRHEERDERDRKERRENEISLFNKLDEMKTNVDAKFDRLFDAILNIRK